MERRKRQAHFHRTFSWGKCLHTEYEKAPSPLATKGLLSLILVNNNRKYNRLTSNSSLGTFHITASSFYIKYDPQHIIVWAINQGNLILTRSTQNTTFRVSNKQENIFNLSIVQRKQLSSYFQQNNPIFHNKNQILAKNIPKTHSKIGVEWNLRRLCW